MAGLHGNEQAPVHALVSKGISFISGNLEALRSGVRFIDTDLNASFGIETEGYERDRAKEILALISPDDVVIDFHTTSAKGPPFAILTDLAMLPLAERTGVAYAVLMTHNIKNGHALINVRDGVSVELHGYDTEDSFKTTLDVINHLESGAISQLELFEVFEKITEPGTYENFVPGADGTVPVLVGEESYNFIGLRARKLKVN